MLRLLRQTWKHKSHPRWAAVLLVGGCLLSQGCSWNWAKLKGEGFSDEMSQTGQYLRQHEKSDGSPLGTSNKALEIERNLGYR